MTPWERKLDPAVVPPTLFHFLPRFTKPSFSFCRVFPNPLSASAARWLSGPGTGSRPSAVRSEHAVRIVISEVKERRGKIRRK